MALILIYLAKAKVLRKYKIVCFAVMKNYTFKIEFFSWKRKQRKQLMNQIKSHILLAASSFVLKLI